MPLCFPLHRVTSQPQKVLHAPIWVTNRVSSLPDRTAAGVKIRPLGCGHHSQQLLGFPGNTEAKGFPAGLGKWQTVTLLEAGWVCQLTPTDLGQQVCRDGINNRVHPKGHPRPCPRQDTSVRCPSLLLHSTERHVLGLSPKRQVLWFLRGQSSLQPASHSPPPDHIYQGTQHTVAGRAQAEEDG